MVYGISYPVTCWTTDRIVFWSQDTLVTASRDLTI